MAVRVTPAGGRLLNRELSWLEFNARVLELAKDPSVPLLERVRFCAIFSNNLDEFFMVRVAGLLEQAGSDYARRSADGMAPAETLAAIRARALELFRRQSRLWNKELRRELATAGVEIIPLDECTEKEVRTLTAFYDREVFPILTPLAVGSGFPFPYISGLSLSLAVLAADPETGEERFARVKVPEGLPRFVSAGGRYVMLESLISHFLPRLFPGMEIVERTTFRVTRDSDFELSDDADDLVGAVESELRQRRFGDVVRLELSEKTSPRLRRRLVSGLQLSDDQLYEIDGPLDLSEVDELLALDRPDLRFESWAPVIPPRFASSPTAARLFEELRRGDVLHHMPYDSFRGSFETFALAASDDPDVIAMKTTVYRTGDDSALVSALIECAEEGKQAVCVVELKARFDERRNIAWSRAMEQAGVHVVHGFPDLKIHAKMALVVRREADGPRRYVHIGTGNYNADTARHYEDIGVFTSDEDITADVADLFNYITGFGKPQRFRKLLVAPLTMRSKLIEEIRRVAASAASGETSSVRLKLNQLVDPAIVEELYSASQVGARIDICARAICMLRPGVKGLSETVHVRSIVDRFLEHSRIFEFQTPEATTVYVGSADLMPRNLDRRIEVLVPIEAARARQEVTAILDSVFADDTNAWELNADGEWKRCQPERPEQGRSHQRRMQRRALARARRSALRGRER